MMIDLDKPVVENLGEKQCLYTCNEPKGSLVLGVIAMFVGLVIVPVFVRIFDESVVFTIDNFLLLMFEELAKNLGYHFSLAFSSYVIYFVFSFLGGMTCAKPYKALALPFTYIAIAILGFFFLALFVIGIPINYDDFFFGLVYNLLKFVALMVFPALLGSMATRISLSKKSCFVKGKGVTVKG